MTVYGGTYYQRCFGRYHSRPPMPCLWPPPFPRLEVRNLHPKLQSKIAAKRVHIDEYVWKAEFFGNRECGHNRRLPEIFCLPLLSQKRVKLRISNLLRTFKVDRNKSPCKNLGKVVVGVVRESRKFSGHPYI